MAAQAMSMNASPGQVSATFLENRLKKAQSRTDLSEENRSALVSTYGAAQEWLEKAKHYKDQKKEYLAARTRAPKQVLRIQKDIDKLQTSPDRRLRRVEKKTLQEIEQLLEAVKAEHAGSEARVDELTQQLSDETARPETTRAALADVTRQLEKLTQALAGQNVPAEPQAAADFWLDKARLQALTQQRAMLEQKILSHPARQKLAKARLDEAKAKLTLIASAMQKLEDLLNKRRKQEAQQVSEDENSTEQSIAAKYPQLKPIAAENADLSAELEKITQALAAATRKDSALRQRVKRLEEEYLSTRRKVEIAGLKEALGQVLLERRLNLPDTRRFLQQEKQVSKQITETGLQQIRHEERLRALGNETVVMDGYLSGMPPQEAEKLVKPTRKLLARRATLLGKLIETDEAYLRELGELNLALQKVLEKVQIYDAFLAEHLLWVRNTPVLSLSDLDSVRMELKQLFNVGIWTRVGGELVAQLKDPYMALGLLLILLFILWGRRLLKMALVAKSAMVAKPAGGSFMNTLKALFLSLLLPVPYLLLILLIAWLLKHTGEGTVEAYANALSQALIRVAGPLYSLLLIHSMTIPRGLLAAHFGWRKQNIQRLRRVMVFLICIFVPFSVLTSLVAHVGALGLTGALIKLTFIPVSLSFSIMIYMVFNPNKGMVAEFLHQRKNSYLYHFRWLWFAIMLLMPLGLIMLSVFGYVYTAATLLNYLINTLWLLAGLVLMQQLAEHWLLLSRRRIAYKAALQRRKLMAEKRNSDAQDSEAAKARELGEVKIDLVALSAESRRLLSAAILLMAAVGLWLIWSRVMPALSYLDTIPLWQHGVSVDGVEKMLPVTVGDLLLVVAIISATLIAAKNLPSLLEIILLQYFRFSAGSRYAARTLSGYLILALGVVLVFNAVGGDWGQIQWLVAALSVGIGFGLQEIVANFISGLIILFERPIRVGDFVTVGDTDGTVTRIRIRATTILTRDNKELLVPNREFITGRLLNWSLSDQSTRLKLEVGIPYGSDVTLAEKLMLQAAQEYEQVQSDPKPFVYFRNFGDSALILELRCHIDSVDNRVKTLSELHHAIDRKFRAAKIEIPFPQQDVHMNIVGPLEVKF